MTAWNKEGKVFAVAPADHAARAAQPPRFSCKYLDDESPSARIRAFSFLRARGFAERPKPREGLCPPRGLGLAFLLL